MPSSKLMILVSSCWENNFIHNNEHNLFILSLVFLKLLIVSVAFFLGHSVLYSELQCHAVCDNTPCIINVIVELIHSETTCQPNQGK